MTGARVIIVEDESDLCELMRIYLEKMGYQVYTADTRRASLQLVHDVQPHMIVLDIELPDGDGLEICRTIRTFSDVPIIFVTCRRESEDIYNGLAQGADDYLIKPFDPNEMVARVEGHLQKRKILSMNVSRDHRNIWENGRLRVDLQKMEVYVDGQQVQLYTKEVQLLRFFIEHPNQVFSVDELFERVWGLDNESEYRTVYAHIYNLRQKLEASPDKPELFRTVRGIGYLFATE